MTIDSISGGVPNIISSTAIKQTFQPEKNSQVSFGNVLGDFIGSVNQDQLDSKSITNQFILGGDVELHEVMIASEKAKTSLELLMEIRNKAVDMYKELTRMTI